MLSRTSGTDLARPATTYAQVTQRPHRWSSSPAVHSCRIFAAATTNSPLKPDDRFESPHPSPNWRKPSNRRPDRGLTTLASGIVQRRRRLRAHTGRWRAGARCRDATPSYCSPIPGSGRRLRLPMRSSCGGLTCHKSAKSNTQASGNARHAANERETWLASMPMRDGSRRRIDLIRSRCSRSRTRRANRTWCPCVTAGCWSRRSRSTAARPRSWRPTSRTRRRAGLIAQLCGDAHLSNFGVFASPERTLLFDLNDFDETLPGPFEYDVKRMAASFTIAARNNGFSKAEARESHDGFGLGLPRGDGGVRPDGHHGHLVRTPVRGKS